VLKTVSSYYYLKEYSREYSISRLCCAFRGGNRQGPPDWQIGDQRCHPIFSLQGHITVIKIDLDREKGRVIWEAVVESSKGRFEIYVDATTGEILKMERDN